MTYKNILLFLTILMMTFVTTWVATARREYLRFLSVSSAVESPSSVRIISNVSNLESSNGSVSGGSTKNMMIITKPAPKTATPSPSEEPTPFPTNTSLNSICHFTKSDPFDPAILKMAKKYPPLQCRGYLSLVYIEDDILRVNLTKIQITPKAKHFSNCRYKPFTKGTKNDVQIIYGSWSPRFKDNITLNSADEFVVTECVDKQGKPLSKTYLSRIAWDEERDDQHYSTIYAKHSEKYAPKEKMNLLLVGLDGCSEGNFQRSMPKTRNYLLHNLRAIQLEKYNKVGLNTFPNILPMTTGHSESYFKKNWTHKEHFDKLNHHFIWSEFKDAGYRTALDLEERYITAFHYLKKGWKIPPVDHYSRAITLALDGDKLITANSSNSKLCRGDKPSMSFHTDFLLQLSARYTKTKTPYFALSFLTRLTHDNQNLASAGDDLYLQFFQHLNKTNAFNNTIVLFFSDHGERFGSIRRTFTGVIESKSPLGYFMFPPWFESKYPDVMNTFRTNAKRLVTVFDLHATFRDIIYFQSKSKPIHPDPGLGISLFQTFPTSRTCAEAGIPTVYCNCNSLTQPKIDPETKQLLASTVTATINNKLTEHEDCLKLSPKSVQSVLQLSHPAADRLRKEVVQSTSVLYHLSLLTTPGKGVFEAVVEINKAENKSEVLGSISRLDMYRGEKDCVQDPVLRPFCYCG